MARRQNPKPRGVNRYLNYSFEDAAAALGCSKATIRRRVKAGELPAISDVKPFLILGVDLADHRKRARAPKHRLGPGEFLCFRCREPRPAAFGVADYIPTSPQTGNLQALCPHCGTVMNRAASAKALPSLAAFLTIEVKERSDT